MMVSDTPSVVRLSDLYFYLLFNFQLHLFYFLPFGKTKKTVTHSGKILYMFKNYFTDIQCICVTI